MDGLSPEPFPPFRALKIPSGFPSLPPIPLHCGGVGQPWNLSPTARTLANPPHKSARSVRIAADLGGMQGWRSLRAAALRNASPALCGLDRSQAGPRAAWKSIHGRVEAAHGECCSQEGQTESGEIQIKRRGVCHWRAGAGGMELGQARKRSMVWEERREVAGWVRGLKAGRWLLDQTPASHLDSVGQALRGDNPC